MDQVKYELIASAPRQEPVSLEAAAATLVRHGLALQPWLIPGRGFRPDERALCCRINRISAISCFHLYDSDTTEKSQ